MRFLEVSEKLNFNKNKKEEANKLENKLREVKGLSSIKIMSKSADDPRIFVYFTYKNNNYYASLNHESRFWIVFKKDEDTKDTPYHTKFKKYFYEKDTPETITRKLNE